MNLLKSSIVSCGLLLGLLAPSSQATSYAYRQYYSSWARHPYQSYYYRSYYGEKGAANGRTDAAELVERRA